MVDTLASEVQTHQASKTDADEKEENRTTVARDPTAPLPRIIDRPPTWSVAAALAREWELNELAERLARMAASND
jgi:DNA polymerase I